MECKKEENRARYCNCSYPCEKKGMCCICLAYHRSRYELPACYFTDTAERTYDRSINNFLRSSRK
ncbi:MAG: hypothetical protein QXL17_00910 [Candidatus Thermoplasmatota archaeon]